MAEPENQDPGGSNLFESLTEKDLEFLGTSMEERNLSPKEILFREGDPSNGLYIIAEGQLEIVKHVPPKGEEIIATLQAGQPVGEMTLVLQGATRTATARSVEGAKLLFMSFEQFNRLTAEENSMILRLALGLAKILAYRLRAMNYELLRIVENTKPGQPPAFPNDAVSFRKMLSQCSF